MRRVMVFILAALFLATVPIAVSAAPPPQSAIKAAEDGLGFARDVMGRDPQAYGFSNGDEVSRVTLGPGFQLHYVDGNRLRTDTQGSLMRLTYPVDAWQFIVEVDGKPKTFLIVAPEGGSYQVASVGGDAAPFGTALANFNRLARDGNGAPVEPILVKDYPVHYLVAKLAGGEYIIPGVTPDRADFAGGRDNSKLWPAADFVRWEKEIQKETDKGTVAGGFPSPSRTSTPAHQPARAVPWAALALISAGLAAVSVAHRIRVKRGRNPGVAGESPGSATLGH